MHRWMATGGRGMLAVLAVLVVAVVSPFPRAGAEPPSQAAPHEDDDESCGYDVPALVDGVVNDPGGEFELRVLVLLDGPTRARGVAVMDEAANAFAPLDIRMTHRFRPVQLEGDGRDPGALIREARELLGGQVPHGYDVVHVFTDKDIFGWGLANCIGGVATRRFAFSVSEDSGERTPNITAEHPMPVWPWGEFAAKTVAHELGHLMGGQHQLANCVEGVEPDDDLPRPCTLMDPSIKMTMKLSTANAAVLRTHAVNYLPRPRN